MLMLHTKGNPLTRKRVAVWIVKIKNIYCSMISEFLQCLHSSKQNLSELSFLLPSFLSLELMQPSLFPKPLGLIYPTGLRSSAH